MSCILIIFSNHRSSSIEFNKRPSKHNLMVLPRVLQNSSVSKNKKEDKRLAKEISFRRSLCSTGSSTALEWLNTRNNKRIESKPPFQPHTTHNHADNTIIIVIIITISIIIHSNPASSNVLGVVFSFFLFVYFFIFLLSLLFPLLIRFSSSNNKNVGKNVHWVFLWHKAWQDRGNRKYVNWGIDIQTHTHTNSRTSASKREAYFFISLAGSEFLFFFHSTSALFISEQILMLG